MSLIRKITNINSDQEKAVNSHDKFLYRTRLLAVCLLSGIKIVTHCTESDDPIRASHVRCSQKGYFSAGLHSAHMEQ